MKNRHPLLIGIYSSLIVSGIAYFYPAVGQIDFFERSVPLWTLLVSFSLLIFVSSTLLSYLLSKPRQVFIILSQFPSKPFFASLTNDLLHYLAQHDIQAVIMPPSTYLSSDSEKKWLDKIVRSRHHFIGGIIIPLNTERKDIRLLEFVKAFKKPVLFLDAPLPIQREEYPTNSTFIGFDNKKGGKLAAMAMLHEFERLGIEKPRVLVIASNLVTDRQKAFMSHLEDIGRLRATSINEGEYRREKAIKIFEHVLAGNNDDSIEYDGIFCTNDEMALGVQDVINKTPAFPKERTVLIGYDGIREATKIIDSGNSAFKNSVLQDTNKLADASVLKLVSMINKHAVERIELIEPTYYRHISSTTEFGSAAVEVGGNNDELNPSAQETIVNKPSSKIIP